MRLTLQEKIDIIRASSNGKLSVRALGEQFKVGKTQVSEILKKKAEILQEWETNGNSSSRKIFSKSSPGSDVDATVYEWFCRARAAKIPISGPLIQEKALEVASQLGLGDFKASSGWLEKFRKRHNISFKAVSGEAGSVDMDVVEDWQGKLGDLCKDYAPEDIFNCDETGLYFRALPEKQ